MSIILGLNANHADSSACLIKDGKLLLRNKIFKINLADSLRASVTTLEDKGDHYLITKKNPRKKKIEE